jgi:rubrerythrin
MEKDGEKFYRELKEKVEMPELKIILEMLANDEVKHFEAVLNMSKNTNADFEDTIILSKAGNVFEKMKTGNEKFADFNDQISFFCKAQEIENKSEDFYKEKSKEETNPDFKQIFIKLAAEEEKHFFLIDNIINFLRAPNEWVENAEYHHLDDY